MKANRILTDNRPTNVSLAGRYLSFVVGGDYYGLPALWVREIIRFETPALVPQLPAHAEDVINLRGNVIPVVRLRLKFRFPPNQAAEHISIIVAQNTSPMGSGRPMGKTVDGIEGVIQIADEELEETSGYGSRLNADCILGLAKIRDTVNVLLDIDRLLAVEILPSAVNQQPA